jgi:hypothetical protein
MRGNRSKSDTEGREQNQSERLGKFIVCMFYEGILPSGVKSPGYLDTTVTDRRPAAYVVPVSAFEEQNIQRTVDPVEPWLSIEYGIKWARENVRLIKLKSNLGLSSKEIMKDYMVRVPYPMSSASTGELIRKPGRAASQASVPNGHTADDIQKQRMIDPKVPLVERQSIARSRYGNGVPSVPDQEQFPAPGDHWIGSD